jgi:hypothetical protein
MSGVTGAGNLDVDCFDAGRRFTLLHLFVRGRRTQTKQRPPLGTTEDTGNRAKTRHLYPLLLASSRSILMKASSL